MDFNYLADKYGTPLYVYDFDFFETQFLTFKQAFVGSKNIITFAVKSNPNLSVINKFASLGAGADCVSIGEIKRALAAKVPKNKIIFSGVGKTEEEMSEALKNDILMINIESLQEVLFLSDVASQMKKTAKISVRINPDINPKTHPHISTGLKESKFGVDIETAKKIYEFARDNKYLEPIGIHFHIGSQITDIIPIKEAAEYVWNFAKSLRNEGIDLKYFDVGGGLGVRYYDESTVSLLEYGNLIKSIVNDKDITIITEPGRFLTANGGWLLTRILYEKKNKNKHFIVVDAGMNDFIRPVLYGAKHKISITNDDYVENPTDDSFDREISHGVDVVGPVCESADFLAKGISIRQIMVGEIMLISDVGAYGFSMSSNYNSRPRAAEVAIEKGKDRLIRSRETFDDLTRNERDFLHVK